MRTVNKYIYFLFITLFITNLFSEDLKLSIAILPFKNLTGNENNDWIGVGFSETMSAGLSQFKKISVVERANIKSVLKEIELSLTGLVDDNNAIEAGKLVGAEYLILGSYQLLNNSIRVSYRTIDVNSGIIVSGNNITNMYENIFSIQDSIIGNIAYNLINTKTPNYFKSVVNLETNDLKAYELAIKGNIELEQGKYSTAVNYFEEALKIDRSYNRARKGLNYSYWPMNPGNEWYYNLKIISNNMPINDIIIKRKIIGTSVCFGKNCVIEETKPVDNGEFSAFSLMPGARLYFYYNNFGIALYKVKTALGTYELPEGEQYWKLPLEKGAKWESLFPVNGQLLKTTYEVSNTEEIIDINIGTFKCVKLIANMENPNQNQTKMIIYYWINKGIGLIKYETISLMNINGKIMKTKSSAELLKYNLVKSSPEY